MLFVPRSAEQGRRHELCVEHIRPMPRSVTAKNASIRRWLCVAVAGMLPLGAALADVKLPKRVEVPPDELQRAQSVHAEMLRMTPSYPDTRLQSYVASIGERLVHAAPQTNVRFAFTVLDSQGVFAYSLGNGEIVISRGMLAHLNSEAELAAVLAHEVGHVIGLHHGRTWQQLRKAVELESKLSSRFSSEQARDAVNALMLARVRGYSREQEIEADAWGDQLLKKAGFPVDSSLRLLGFLTQYDLYAEQVGMQLWELPTSGAGTGVFSTHPSSQIRLELALKRAGLSAPPPRHLSDPQFLSKLQGLVYGLPERYGVQHGTSFVDAARRYELTLPENWYVFGHEEEIVVAALMPDLLLRIRVEPRSKIETIREALRRFARAPQLDPKTIETVHTPTAAGELLLMPPSGTLGDQLFAVMDVAQHRLFCAALSFNEERWQLTESNVRLILQSLRSPAADARTTPLRLSVSQSMDGTLPVAAPVSKPRETLALLNQSYPDRPVTAGQWIKTIQ